MKTVRWGLLSTANINRRLIPAIRASSRGRLAAVASRNTYIAQAYAAEWGIPQAFGSYQSMLDSGEVDAVYIGLPNHLHAEWSIKAMRAGVHVLCEKPFALSLEDADAMIAASRETGMSLAEAFMYRHHPQTKIAGEWTHSGRLGVITMVNAVFNYAMGSRDNVRLEPEFGGGCLWDVGVYPLSFAQYIFKSAPEMVYGMQWLGESSIDETFSGQMVYSGGGFAQISSSFRTPFHIFAEVIGTEGRLVLNRPFVGMEDRRKLIFEPADDDAFEIEVPETELYSGEVEDMHAAILDGQPSYLTLEETRDHVRTVLALYASARSNQPVRIEG